MAWSTSYTVTIDHTKCGTANSTDFPMLFYGTYDGTGGEPDLRAVGSGGGVQNASGYDIAFFSDLGLTSALKFERVAWDGTTGAVEFWVKIPTLTFATDTVIYLAYGDSGISTDQQDAANTWNSGYKGVYHFEGNSLDSTSNNRDGTDSGMVYGTTGGKYSQGAVFTGASRYSVISPSELATGSASFTYSAWLYAANVSGYKELMCYGNNASNSAYRSHYLNNATIEVGIWGESYNFPDVPISATTWTLYHITWNNKTVTCYKNGTAGTAVTFSSTPNIGTQSADLFAYYAHDAYFMNGYSDEVRLYNGLVSTSQITSEYNNQNSPSTFYTITSSNSIPNTPTNSTPVNAATNQNRQVTLTGSAYSDPENDAHVSSQWQVATDSGFSSVVWDSGTTTTNKTSIVVNSTNGTFAGALSGKSRLGANTEYYWRVRYSDI